MQVGDQIQASKRVSRGFGKKDIKTGDRGIVKTANDHTPDVVYVAWDDDPEKPILALKSELIVLVSS
jgi:NAD-dependent DNA ligase